MDGRRAIGTSDAERTAGLTGIAGPLGRGNRPADGLAQKRRSPRHAVTGASGPN